MAGYYVPQKPMMGLFSTPCPLSPMPSRARRVERYGRGDRRICILSTRFDYGRMGKLAVSQRMTKVHKPKSEVLWLSFDHSRPHF